MTLIGMISKMSEGLGRTCAIFFLTLLFSLPLGLVVALLRMSKSKVLQAVTRVYISILRGTPLMLQLIAVAYGPFYLFGYTLLVKQKLLAIIIAFALNYAAYFAEIYRGGILSVPKGQYEAGKVLGFTKAQTFVRIILPQVVKKILPAMGNEVITLVKDTALVQVLGVAELFHVAQTQSGRLVSVMPLFIAGVFYFMMNWAVSRFFDFAEARLGYYD